MADRLESLDDAQLATLLAGTAPAAGDWAPFWGSHQTIDVEGTAVFVKRIPVTDLEDANRFSTRNHYELPLFYNYGAGSVGFGAFRELAAHVKTTGWVLDGTIETFPLTYHHRLIDRSPVPLDAKVLDGYVTHWAGSKAVGRFAADRAAATRELVVCLEHIPSELQSWIGSNQAAVGSALDQIDRTLSFLQAEGIVHFDAHFGNILTDGEQLYVSDFGLLVDGEFELSDTERAFLDAHQNYDRCLALLGLGTCLIGPWMRLAPGDRAALHQRAGVEASDANPFVVMAKVIGIIEEVPRFGLAVEPPHVDAIVRYRDVIIDMMHFLTDLRGNPRKDTVFDDEHFGQLLRAADTGM